MESYLLAAAGGWVASAVVTWKYMTAAHERQLQLVLQTRPEEPPKLDEVRATPKLPPPRPSKRKG